MRSGTAALLSVLIIMISMIGFFVTATGKNNYEEYKIVTDGEGRFFELRNKDSNAVLKGYTRSIENGNMLINNFNADYCLTCKGKTFIIGNKDSTLTVIKYPQGPDVTNYIENTELKDRCIALSKDMCIYLVDKKNDKEIKKYDKLIYEKEPIETGTAVQYLFTENTSGKVYAATSKGIFDTQERQLINCSVPQYPIKGNGGYYSDKNGDIYKFSENSGFEKIMSANNSTVCTLENGLLYKKGNKIIFSSYSGEIFGTYTCHADIDDIYSSGKDIAWTHNKNINFISQNDFVKSIEESSQISDINSRSENDSSKNISSPESSVIKNLSIYSDIYNIGYDTITDIPPKTKINKFLKNIHCDSADIILKDNSGRQAVTGYVGNGWSIELSDGQKKKIYHIIVKGDVNGDGAVNADDIRAVFKYIDDTDSINEQEFLAADCNDDGIIDTIDMFMIQAISRNVR